MKKPLLVILFALLSFPAHAGNVEEVKDGAVTLEVCRVAPAEVRLLWADAQNKPYRTFAAVRAVLAAEKISPALIMNAGIFELGGIPSGLHVENGVERLPLNRKDGTGNFFLKPNGVFYIHEGKAGVMETEAWAKAGIKPALALQSGPLLLQGGKIHPLFQANSPNAKHRNGVGVDDQGRVVFVITRHAQDQHVNLHRFASIFLRLGCRDALFLDGDISRVWRTGDKAMDGNHLGAFLVVAAPEKKP